MRLISQDGTIDVPYEQVVIQRFKTEIYFLNKNLTGIENLVSDMEIATYSTEAKAQKAMEMLSEQYAHMKRVECMSVTLASCELTTLSNKDAKLLGDEVQKLMCFQFPKDEDMEV